MVMKRNAMRKNLRQTILKSMGRYLAIVAIIALGAGMFVGLLSTKMDMVETAQNYTDNQNMFDLRLLSTYGWAKGDVAEVAQMPGIVDAEGSVSLDVIAAQAEGKEAVYRLHAIPERVNKVYLLGGRMPEKPNECLVDGSNADDSVLGMKFTVSAGNEGETLEKMAETAFTVVGYVSTPIYMDMSRGNTSIGSGNLANYVYIPMDAFDVDYYTEINVTIEGAYQIYTDEFTSAMEAMAEELKPGVTVLAQERYVTVKNDAENQYADGLTEYEDGLKEFEDGREQALAELEEALKKLEDGQKEIDANWQTVLDGEKQIADAEAELDKNEQLLLTSRQELAAGKAEAYGKFAEANKELTENYKAAVSGLKQVEDGLSQINDGIVQLESGLAEIRSGMEKLDLMLGILEPAIKLAEETLEQLKNAAVVDSDLIARLETELAEQKKSFDEYTVQREELADMQTEYTGQLEELKKQRVELEQTKKTLEDGLDQIDMGYKELDSQRAQAESRFAEAEAKIEAGEVQLQAGRKELNAKKEELAAGRAELEQAQAELDEGWAEYESGKAEAEKELADAEAKLNDAKAQLDEAREILDSMEEAEVYILDRNTNVGYLAVNSNSDIVAGVSRVFPAFFLLVAALVCITTMTRMVDEERTQIGVLKALGYSNGSIINKYLAYSGSAAVVGCGLGVVVGSIVFPKILWQAYRIILNLTPDVALKFNWPLCILVVAAYTAVSMLVTWYCCRRELREVPAELIRPKSPTAGKKILLEYLPFWNKIGFLNKVMFRNVFRYRQRLLMMLVGIGGCTALLVAGFGIGDSIMNIVDYQFAEVTTYDMEVYFSEGQTKAEQEAFCKELQGDVEEILFFHQVSGNLDHGDKTMEIYLMASGEDIGRFIDFHDGEQQLTMPGVGEAYLTVGAAEATGIQVGDTVEIRNPDLQTLQVKISGIFENHVYNYAIVRPETIAQQWGETPEYQMAFITVGDDQDVHAAGAKASGMEDVMNVAISQDLAEQVDSMLEAMNLVVLTVVICAGLLAIIVIYNLTNISIKERIREIATIKVLGFNSRETAAYVFKENLFLTGMGTVLGMGGGFFLLKFIMSQIKIDMVWFLARLEPLSLLWAVVLTMLSACLVDFLLYFRLEKINMAEALKSVE